LPPAGLGDGPENQAAQTAVLLIVVLISTLMLLRYALRTAADGGPSDPSGGATLAWPSLSPRGGGSAGRTVPAWRLKQPDSHWRAVRTSDGTRRDFGRGRLPHVPSTPQFKDKLAELREAMRRIQSRD
jgi:hypothetical protein